MSPKQASVLPTTYFVGSSLTPWRLWQGASFQASGVQVSADPPTWPPPLSHPGSASAHCSPQLRAVMVGVSGRHHLWPRAADFCSLGKHRVSISTLEFTIMAPFSCQSKFYNNLDHWREQSHRVPPPQSSHRRGQILSTRKNLSRLTPSRLPLNADKPSANLTIQRRAMGQFPCSKRAPSLNAGKDTIEGSAF